MQVKIEKIYRVFDPRSNPVTPMIDTTTPPISIHIALSVGVSVKAREMSELTEFDALIPNIISSTPAARMASEMVLSMGEPP
jgi:hypothetical protein